MKNAFSGKKAYEHLKALAEDIGPRHAGSKAEAKAARYIRDYFKSLGLKTRLEPYGIYSFEDATATLKRPDGAEIPCRAIPMTGPTPKRGITREVVFLEDASPLFLDERVRDKIVVTFNAFAGDAQARFHELKPAALVSIGTQARRKPFLAGYKADAKRKMGTVPSIRIGLEDGMALIDDLPKTLTLTLATQGESTKRGYNVVADLKGSGCGAGEDEEVVVVCAHYDSVWAGPGAFDNGGGTAAIMELARVFAKKGSPRNLRFIAFGGEEMGLWGAKAYVKTLKDEHDKLNKNKEFERDGLKTDFDRIRFLVNLDMMGPFYGKSTAISLGHADIAASARLLANEERYPLTVRENSVYSSDNMAFNYAGVPSLSFNRCGYGDLGGHTEEDKIDNCSAEGLEHIGRFVETWMRRYILGSHLFPFARPLPEAAKAAVKKWFGTRNPLDYEVFGPEKKYKAKGKKK